MLCEAIRRSVGTHDEDYLFYKNQSCYGCACVNNLRTGPCSDHYNMCGV